VGVHTPRAARPGVAVAAPDIDSVSAPTSVAADGGPLEVREDCTASPLDSTVEGSSARTTGPRSSGVRTAALRRQDRA
jgi:hypothetical protein